MNNHWFKIDCQNPPQFIRIRIDPEHEATKALVRRFNIDMGVIEGDPTEPRTDHGGMSSKHTESIFSH